MASLDKFAGHYYMMGFTFEVFEQAEHLLCTVPGVPPGYEFRLKALDETGHFEMRNGPLAGERVTFVAQENGEIKGLQTGGFELSRISADKAAALPATERLLAPAFEPDAKQSADFAGLLDGLITRSEGHWVDYDLPYPVHEFIQYLNDRNQFIFHGSNNPDIDEFAPVRKSIELRDESGRGNLQAVYGTHDGLWSMFFAIVDRDRLSGSIRNGVMYFHNAAGDSLPVYNFSINQDQLAEQPWCNGALYLLPRATFNQLKLGEKALANEWASEVAVQPIAKLRLKPSDFPFLNQIGGHDDGELARFQDLGTAVRDAARWARLDDETLSVGLPTDMQEQLDTYAALQQTFMPSAGIDMTDTGSEIVLSITSMPPAFRQILSDRFADVLKGS